MNAVGKSLPKKDALDKVTGQAKFIDDYTRQGLLFGVTVRSPEPHIKILSIDTKEALKLKGVVGVFTYKDIPGKNIVPLVLPDYPFLAEDTAKFAGQAIALVAAESEEIAKKAAGLVKIAYKKLPAVFDPLKALEKSAPKVYGNDNIFRRYVIKKGDAESALKNCDIVVEKTYTTNYQVHCYLETQGMLAEMTDTGMVVYGSMQCPFYVLSAVADILGFTKNNVKIIQTTTGGGFGGKEDVPSIVAGHAALLAYHTKRPVKIIYNREEDFISMSKRHPGYIEIKYGATKEGKIVACKARYILDGGAFSTLSPIVLWRGTIHAAGPYDIENVDIESFAVATNKVPCGAFRGFGQPQVCFANESLIDELAEKIGIDPLELRLKNALKPNSRTSTNQKLGSSCGLTETLKKASSEIEWYKKWEEPSKKNGTRRRGVGIASSIYGVCLGAAGKYLAKAGAYVQILQDGSVIVAVGNTDMGQGARTVLSQIAADGVGAPYELVNLIEVDTSRVPDSGPTVASRTTIMSGNAILDACNFLRKKIDYTVCNALRVKPGTKVVAKDGFYYAGNKKIKYENAIDLCYQNRQNLTYNGWWTEEGTSFDINTGLGDAYIVYTFSTIASEVEVDLETGIVKVLKVVSAHDIGKAINPQLAEGQIEGGAVQGVGYGIYENLVLKDGKILNPNFSGYTIPTTMDIPESVKAIIVEKPFKDGPFGAKGLGEPPLIAVAPAILNAIYNATGIRITSLPAIPEKIVYENKLCHQREKSNR